MTENIYPQITSAELNKEKMKNLMMFHDSLVTQMKHYRKLKCRWNVVKNVMHYSKYPVGIAMIGGDVALAITGVGIPVAIAGGVITAIELVGSNIVEDTLMKRKVQKYSQKTLFFKEWIDKMHVFVTDATRDGIIDDREIDQWKALKAEYDTALISLTKTHDNSESHSKNGKPSELQEVMTLEQLQKQLTSMISQKKNGK